MIDAMSGFSIPADLPYFETLLAAVRHFGGPDAVVVAQEAAPGGCINNGFSVTLRSGQCCFVKMNRRASLDMFRQEALGLALLAKVAKDPTVNLVVPQALSHGVEGEHSFLVLEYLPVVTATPRYWEALGHGLALLHEKATNPIFGFEADNYIGITKQRNSWSDKWPDFFARHRLRPQIDLAKRQGLASDALVAAVESIIKRVENLIPHIARASLVHGDLWSGNVLALQGTGGPGTERAGLIDPACYYGDSRVDLAMTELFGGFPPNFHAAYREVRDPGNEYRQLRDLYNLYHLLNHLNIMGAEYAGECLRIAQQYA